MASDNVLRTPKRGNLNDDVTTPKKRLRRSDQENEIDDEITNTEQNIRNFVNSRMENLNLSEIEESGIKAAGQVIGIELENFMCHKNLRVVFDIDKYNCFYIVGANGSGKSAIFAGLNIGLGGKGKSNDRGNSLQAYIKEGETSAKIRITLRNVGDNKHPDYGDRIIVERVIRGGSSTYAIKSGLKNSNFAQTVSTSKKDLDALLKRFSIELENPLCWLSQDRARQFLQQMKPEKLYEIFMITSELKAAEERHFFTEENFLNLNKILEENNKKQEYKRRAYEELQAKATAAQKCAELKRKISEINWCKCWIPYVENQKKLTETEVQVEKNIKKKEEVDQRIKGRNKEMKELQNAVKKLSDEALIYEKQYNETKGVMNNFDRQQNDLNAELKGMVATLKIKQNKIQEADHDINETRLTLESILGKADRDIFGEKTALKERLLKSEKEKANDEDQKKFIASKKEKIHQDRRAKQSELQEAQCKIFQHENDIRKINREIQQAEEIARDHMCRFGRNTSDIIEILKKHERNFKKLPIGPIGMHVKVNNEKYIIPVEYHLRNQLKGYICDNGEDRKMFEQILSRYNIPLPNNINVVQFSNLKHDTSTYAPERHFNTVLRLLDIENPTVYNFIVDKMSIEQVVVMDDDDEARDLMQSAPPSNVRQIVTLMCSDVYPKGPNKPYRYYAGSSYNANLLVQQERGQEFYQQRIQNATKSISEIKIQEEELKKSINHLNNTYNEINNDIKDIDKRIYEIDKVISNLKTELFELDKTASRETMITNTKKLIDDLTAKKETMDTEYKKIKENMKIAEANKQEFKEKVDETMNSLEVILSKVKNHDAELKKKREELNNFDNATDELRIESAKYQKRIDKLCENKNQFLEEERKINLMLKDALTEYKKPENMTDPPDFNIIPAEDKLKRLLEKNETELRKTQRLCGSESVTQKELDDAKQELELAIQDVQKIKSASKKAQHAFEKRKELYKRVLEDLPRRLKEKFCEYMLLRNYVGDLHVDRENKRIVITVETHRDAHKNPLNNDDNDDVDYENVDKKRRTTASKKKKVVQDLKGLSGGERSYTTACFVMALWVCVDAPFRLLDEFDVFMDMQNRRIVIELLSELARKNKHIQFFFFTPQSISELNYEDVEVFQLKKNAA